MAISILVGAVIFAVFTGVDSVGHCPDHRTPLEGAFCGLSPTAVTCPHGYYCNSAANDAYAECCPTHCGNRPPLMSTSGKPVYCGRGGERCPGFYHCKVAPNDAWAVCCSD